MKTKLHRIQKCEMKYFYVKYILGKINGINEFSSMYIVLIEVFKLRQKI